MKVKTTEKINWISYYACVVLDSGSIIKPSQECYKKVVH